MESTIQITLQQALEKLANNENLGGYVIDFEASEPIEALQALKLAELGLEVPENKIYYNDDAIDFSDIPEITGKEVWVKGLPS